MRILLIHNPEAGDEMLSGDELGALIRDAGHEVIYQSIKEGDYKSALQESVDLVAVAGGDGTVRKVAMRLIERKVPITVLPMGTANNISKTLGIEGEPHDSIRGWASARRMKFSVGLAKGPWGKIHFLEGVGVGLFTTVMSILDSERQKEMDGLETAEEKMNHALRVLNETLSAYEPHQVKLVLDGEDYSGKYLLLEAMNSKSIGPNLFLAPDADPTDEYLDFVFISEDEREVFADYLSSRLQDKEHPPSWTVKKGRRLQVEWQGVEIRIDDLLWPNDAGSISKSASSNGPSQNIIEISLENCIEFLVPRSTGGL